ncbi:MAG: helix-turn-helix transcriptional regulator [Candidatus Limnocylindrales bacterium]
MRASRLISILLLLQSRGRLTARELADELEVSVRTIYRDVDELGASGIPVYADRGSQGGFQLVEGYRTRLTGLTSEEAGALFLSGYPGPAAQLGLGTVLAAAQLKVLAALPPELRSRASRIRQRFHLDAPGWFQEPDAADYLEAIAEAVWSDRRLHMHYRLGDEDGTAVERLVDPLGVVLKGGIWYLVASAGGEKRTYRISRILDLDLLDEKFLRPDDFDLAGYWEHSVDAYQRSLPSFKAVVRIRQEAVWKLELALGLATATAAVAEAGDPDGSGWLVLRLQMEDFWHAEPQLLMLGADAIVVEPVELRDRMAAAAGALAATYGGDE